jgi:hypothetical protein
LASRPASSNPASDCQVTCDPSGDRTAYWRAAVTVIR